MKGISPIISAVLLIAFTLTVASISGPFFTQQVQKVQESNSEQADKIMGATNTELKLLSARHNVTTSNITVSIQNTGSSIVRNFTLTVFGNKPYHRVFNKRIPRGGIVEAKMPSGDPSDYQSIQIADVNRPYSLEKTLTGTPSKGDLISYWSADSNGDVFLNSTREGLSGKILNGSVTCTTALCPSYESGKFGNAVKLDGVNEKIIISDDDRLDTGSFTFSLWFKLNRDLSCDGNNNWRELAGKGRHGSSSTWHIVLEESTAVAFDVNNDRWWPNGRSDSMGPVGEWHRYTFTYNGKNGVKKFYKDGQLVDSIDESTGPVNPSTDPLQISNGENTGCPAGSGHVPGSFDEIKYWNKVLPPEKISNPAHIN